MLVAFVREEFMKPYAITAAKKLQAPVDRATTATR
jgi:hypothetical protein